MKKILKEAVEELGTYLTLEDEGERFMIYATRENGNTYEEEAGDKDIDEAYRVLEFIENTLGDKVEGNVDTFDEWTNLKFNF